MWNIQDVKNIIVEVNKEHGYTLDLPIKQNNRLEKVVAYCSIEYNRATEELYPTRLEFGRDILNVDDYDTLKQIVLHEYAHAIATDKYHCDCGHDDRFVDICKQIGCYETKTHVSTKTQRELAKAKAKTSKYTIICEHCGAETHANRKTELLKRLEKYPNRFRCNACGELGALTLRQNR